MNPCRDIFRFSIILTVKFSLTLHSRKDSIRYYKKVKKVFFLDESSFVSFLNTFANPFISSTSGILQIIGKSSFMQIHICKEEKPSDFRANSHFFHSVHILLLIFLYLQSVHILSYGLIHLG